MYAHIFVAFCSGFEILAPRTRSLTPLWFRFVVIVIAVICVVIIITVRWARTLVTVVAGRIGFLRLFQPVTTKCILKRCDVDPNLQFPISGLL